MALGRTRPGPVALLTLLGLAGVVAFGAQRLLARDTRDEREIRQLKADYSKLSGELSELRRRDSQVTYTGPSDLAAFGPEEREAAKLEARRKRMKFAAALDRRLATEGVDAAWSEDSLAQIRNSISTHASGSWLVDAKCGMTLCRVVVGHNSAEAQMTLPQSMSALPPFDQGTHYHPGDPSDSRPTTTLYIVRKGYRVKDAADEARRP